MTTGNLFSPAVMYLVRNGVFDSINQEVNRRESAGQLATGNRLHEYERLASQHYVDIGKEQGLKWGPGAYGGTDEQGQTYWVEGPDVSAPTGLHDIASSAAHGGAANPLQSFADSLTPTSSSPSTPDLGGFSSQFQDILDGYTSKITELTSSITDLQEKYATDLKASQDLANRLRQEVIFGNGGGSRNVAQARYSAAGRSRRGLLGGGSSPDSGPLGAELL